MIRPSIQNCIDEKKEIIQIFYSHSLSFLEDKKRYTANDFLKNTHNWKNLPYGFDVY